MTTKVLVLTLEVYSYSSMLVAGALESQLRGFLDEVHVRDVHRPIAATDVYTVGLYSALYALKYKGWASTLRTTHNESVVVGGPVTQVPELVLTNMSCVDAVVVGKGEETKVDLVEALTSKRDLDSVDGIAYNFQGEVVKTRSRAN